MSFAHPKAAHPRPIPTIDSMAPEVTRTATFALG